MTQALLARYLELGDLYYSVGGLPLEEVEHILGHAVPPATGEYEGEYSRRSNAVWAELVRTVIKLIRAGVGNNTLMDCRGKLSRSRSLSC